MSLGTNVWLYVVGGYKVPTIPPTNLDGEITFVNNAKAMVAILCGLVDSKFVKVM